MIVCTNSFFYYLSYNFASFLKNSRIFKIFLMLHILKNIKTLAAQTGKKCYKINIKRSSKKLTLTSMRDKNYSLKRFLLQL